MNRLSMTLKPLLASLFPLALLAACDNTPAQPDLATAPLAGSSIGGDFELVDTSGQRVTQDNFAGKWRIMYFGYAYCPDICPFDVQKLVKGYNLFAEDNPELAANVVPIFITIDPERDTPDVVAQFTSAFSDDLVGLTGTPEQVDAAAKAYAVFYGKGEENAEGGYLMDHSRAAYLIDPQGNPIATLAVENSGEAVAADLAKWVR
ncbi:SCO family protein [Paraurantiacibacter namhicola]|uniref:SCO1/SenC n=1 Tax=Paraurantiacibacter namhicola TaxID=645517 RepID=A0A1C7D6U4_9SPHN|nr:SCO family protein [Paraurantiacibacter namhicola]ANU07177.1 SCO1/SenC [Paraurantiacibacter namhicola]